MDSVTRSPPLNGELVVDASEEHLEVCVAANGTTQKDFVVELNVVNETAIGMQGVSSSDCSQVIVQLQKLFIV